MEGGLWFPLDPFVKVFLNRYNIAPRKLHPNSYRILTGYLELMHREGVVPNFDMLRHIYRLTKKKGELAFSSVAVPSLNIFVRLKDLPKTWRHMYFVVEYKSDFSDIRRLWVDEFHKVKRLQLLRLHSAIDDVLSYDTHQPTSAVHHKSQMGVQRQKTCASKS